jgi:hypothetical protein
LLIGGAQHGGAMDRLLMGFLVAVLALQGCATKTYGRLDPV